MTGVRRILITAAVVALSAAAVVPAASTADGRYDIPKSVKRQFVKECAKAGAPRRKCRCAIRRLDKAYTFRQYIRLLRYVEKHNKFPRKARRIIISCR